MKATQIRFINPEGRPDQTEFDTQDFDELKELWWDFCLENRIIIETERVEIED